RTVTGVQTCALPISGSPARHGLPVGDRGALRAAGRKPGPVYLLFHLDPHQFGVEGAACRGPVAAVVDPYQQRPGMAARAEAEAQIGRASCRERGWRG